MPHDVCSSFLRVSPLPGTSPAIHTPERKRLIVKEKAWTREARDLDSSLCVATDILGTSGKILLRAYSTPALLSAWHESLFILFIWWCWVLDVGSLVVACRI